MVWVGSKDGGQQNPRTNSGRKSQRKKVHWKVKEWMGKSSQNDATKLHSMKNGHTVTGYMSN
jgi:hypothetical protein